MDTHHMVKIMLFLIFLRNWDTHLYRICRWSAAESAAENAAESAAEIQLLSCRHNAAIIAADTTCGGKAYHMIIKVDD